MDAHRQLIETIAAQLRDDELPLFSQAATAYFRMQGEPQDEVISRATGLPVPPPPEDKPVFSRLQLVVDMAADAESRAALEGLLAETLRSWDPKTWGLDAFSNEPMSVRLRVRDQVLTVSFPRTRMSMVFILEVLQRGDYYVEGAVDEVVDLGANLGFATMYLGLLFPKARFTCVEPLPSNVEYLKKNVAHLGALVHGAALGATHGTCKLLQFHPSAHGTNSTVFKSWNRFEGTEVEVPMVTVDDIFEPILKTGRSYGIKMDCEGAEFVFLDRPDVIRNARWITGELHFGEEVTDEQAARLRSLLAERHQVTRSQPFFTGNSFVYAFQAIPKR